MTIDETKDELYRLLSDCVNNSYPIRNNTQKGRYRNAVNTAIASLEAWGEIKQEINDLFSKPACYMPNYDAYKMLLDIIDKHIKEVKNE